MGRPVPAFAFHLLITLPAAVLFLPQLYGFLFGIDAGFVAVDRIYPYPQPREPFRRHPSLIYSHMYLCNIALFVAVIQLTTTAATSEVKSGKATSVQRGQSVLSASLLHTVLGWVYVVSLTLGAAGAIAYAWHQGYGTDGGVAGCVSFTGMALACVVPCWLGLWSVLFNKDRAAHNLWMLRSFVAVWGSGVFFRVLANTFLVWVSRVTESTYPSWNAMIWMSWLIPLAGVEVYRALTKPPPCKDVRRTM